MRTLTANVTFDNNFGKTKTIKTANTTCEGNPRFCDPSHDNSRKNHPAIFLSLSLFSSFAIV
jgi:hypothetical protein